MKNYVNAKVFYVMKIQKNDGIYVPSNMASDGTDLKKFSNVVQRSNMLLIIVQLRSKLLQPFLVEKELHYDNVIRLCITVFLVWIAFTKCLWRFTNNTENDCSWKLFENNKNISDYPFNQRDAAFRKRDLSRYVFYLCFLKPMLIFWEMESVEINEILRKIFSFWIFLDCLKESDLENCGFVHLWRLLMKYRIE